ncbi:MAG TPA: hypothetical protein VGK73_08915 [Polyangiaceae bacterium]
MSKPVFFFLLALSWFGSAFFALRAQGEPDRIAIVHGMLLELAPWHEDLTEEKATRSDRLHTVARGVVQAASDATCADGDPGCIKAFGGGRDELEILLVTAAWWESRLARHVHAGQCRPHECDRGKSRGLAQVRLTSGVPRELWEASEGTDYENTLASMRAAAHVMSRAHWKCFSGDRWHKVFAAYGRGHCSATHQVYARASWFQRKLADYRKRLAAGGVE